MGIRRWWCCATRSRSASPARPTAAWRGPAGRSSCSSTATPRSSRAGWRGWWRSSPGEPGLGIAGALLHYPDGSPQWSGGREPTPLWFLALTSGLPRLLEKVPFYRRARPLGADRPVAVDWVTGAAMAFRRAVWEAAGPLDEGFRFYAQDLDFCLRAARAGFAVEVRPELRVLHHHGATIGRAPGARRRQNPELLWGDLLRWARKHQGPVRAARAEAALRAGVRLRRAGHWVAGPFVAAGKRREWREEDAEAKGAVEALDARPCGGSTRPGGADFE